MTDCHPDCGPITFADSEHHAHENIDGRCWHENEDVTDPTSAERCGELLYDNEPGAPWHAYARCVEPFGTEHSHHDASGSIATEAAPWYPTSAELAAFRCTFDADEAMPGIVAADYMAGPRYPTTRIGSKSVSVTPGGAWPHEREHGIGYRHRQDRADDPAMLHGPLARREANKLRREAYTAALMTGTVDPVELDRAIRAFAPRRETPGDYYERHRLDGVSD